MSLFRKLNSSASDSSEQMRPRYLWFVRDVVFFYALMIVGGTGLAIAGIEIDDPSSPRLHWLIKALATVLVSTVAGVIANNDRKPYLKSLSFVFWGVGLIEGLLGNFRFDAWLMSYLFIVLFISVGGGLSWAILKVFPPLKVQDEKH